MIKFWSYKAEYKKYKKILLKNIDKTISKGEIFFGKQIETFEKKFIKKYKAKYGIAVGSGTEALMISLKTLNLCHNNIKPGAMKCLRTVLQKNTTLEKIILSINGIGDEGLEYIKEGLKKKYNT